MALGVILYADWAEMRKARARAYASTHIAVERDPSYDFGANGRLIAIKRRNLGDMKSPTVPNYGEGPMLVLTKAYPYRQKPSRKFPKGKLLPITMLPLFSVTSKMGCLSYSLPAGPLTSFGTCPMSQRQTVIGEYQRDPHPEVQLQFEGAPDRLMLDKTGKPVQLVHRGEPVGDVELPPVWVCDICYAGKSNYRLYSDQAMKAAWRDAWTRAALKISGGEFFVNAIVDGINHFRALPKYRTTVVSQESQGINANYFRWHDAGDMFNPAYWEAIKEIARRLPRVRFWMPTRQWVTGLWRGRFEDDYRRGDFPDNLIVRPSALFIDAPAPQLRYAGHDAGRKTERVSALAAGTLVTTEPVGSLRVHRQKAGKRFRGPSRGIFDPARPRREDKHLWKTRRTLPISTDEVVDCPAYLGDSDKTRNCIAQNCRVCWQRPDVEVSYDAH